MAEGRGEPEAGGVRLSAAQAATIRAAAAETFGSDVTVRLFGSRAHDEKRGGDIDLHVEANPATATVGHEIRFRAALWRALDEDQLDVVLMPRGAEPRWIDRAALREGVVL
jgi:predicted nucleotidyltransferase